MPRIRFITRDGWETEREVDQLRPTNSARILISPPILALVPSKLTPISEDRMVEKTFELRTFRTLDGDVPVYVEPGGEAKPHVCPESKNLREENLMLRELCGWAFEFFVKDIGVTGLLYAETFEKYQLGKLKKEGEDTWRRRQQKLGLR